MADDQVQGISLGLTLDPSGFSSGIARAKRDLAGLKTAAENIQIGVRRGGVGGHPTNALGPQAVLPGGAPVSPRVSPHFQVSAGSVRDLRTDINAQMRQFAAAGEAVSVPIRLGRVPYAAMRAEISAGIGEVPVHVAIDPRSIAIAIQQLSTGIVTGTAATKGIPRRAAGGGVEANRPVIVGEPGPEVFIPTTNGRISRIAPQAQRGTMVGAKDLAQFPQATMVRNLTKLAASLTPADIKIGQTWHAIAQKQVLTGAQLEGFLPKGQLGTMATSFSPAEKAILNATAAMSPQMKWWANLAHSRALARAAVQGGLPQKAVADSLLPWVRTQVGPNRKLASGVMGLTEKTMQQALSLIKGGDPDEILRSVEGYPLPKVHPFSRNMTGDLSALTLDTIAAQTATSGLMSWKSGSGYSQAPKPGLFRDAMSAAHYEVFEKVKKDYPGGIAQFQAALWAKYRGDAFQKGGRVRRLLSQGAERFGARAQSSYGARYEGFQQAFGNLYGRGANARGMLGKAMRSEGREASMSQPIDLMMAMEEFAANPSAPRERGVSQLGRLKEMFNPREDQPRMADLTHHMFRWLETARFPGAQSILGRSIKTHAGVAGSNEAILKTLAHLPDKPNIVPFTRPWSPIPVAWSRGGRGDLPTGMAGGLGMTGLPHERTPSRTDPRLLPGEDLMLDPNNGIGGRFADFVPGALGEFGRNARGGLVSLWSGGRAEAYRRTIEQGGGTFDPKGMQPKKGYAVGLAQGTAAMVSEADRLGFIRGFREQGKAGAPYVGTWLNEGNIHIDPVDVLRRKREAIKLGIGNEQLAIYDLLRGEEISTKKRYRGGPTLEQTYPNAFISLKNLDRKRRLQVGKRALELGQAYPTTAQGIRSIEAHTPVQMAGQSGSSSDIGYTQRHGGWKSSKIGLNRGFSDKDIREDLKAGFGLSKDMADIFTHEFGHAYSFANTPNFLPYALEQPAAGLMKRVRAPSAYAATDPEEKFAELFLMHQKTGMFPDLFNKRYRGGPALNAVFPGGVDLRAFPRAQRLAIGKALYGAGQEFPFAAQRLAGVKAMGLFTFAEKFGPEEASQTAGITSAKPAYRNPLSREMVGIGPPTIYLNPHGVNERMIQEMGALPKTWADAAIHEFGHAVDYSQGFVSGDLERAGQMQASRLSGSSYAGRNIREKFAELFLHHRRDTPVPVMEDVREKDFESLGLLQKLEGIKGPLLARRDFMESLIKVKTDPMRRAAGGDQSRSGMYIVNELGREKFVPRSREGEIPRDVAARIPGGDGIGLASTGKGSIQEIPGHGARLWSAPEDGWIVPSHLTQKIPHAQTGRRVGGAGGGSESRAAFQARVTAEQAFEGGFTPLGYMRGDELDEPTYARQERARQAQNQQQRATGTTAGPGRRGPQPYVPPDVLRRLRTTQADAAGAVVVSRDVAERPGERGFMADIERREAENRINRAAIRGLTARGTLGGLVGSIFGGGRQRAQAQAEATAIRKEIEGMRPKGVARGRDPLQIWEERLDDSRTVHAAAASGLKELTDAQITHGEVFEAQTKAYNDSAAAVSSNLEKTEKLTELRQREEFALDRASGGAVKNLLSITAAGFGFNVAMQAVNTAVELGVTALRPVVDQLTGFTAANQRVSKGLAELLPQAGTLGTLFGQVGVQAGLSASNVDFLQETLGGGVLAKAAATKAGQAGDLFRAATGVRAPQGLIGGFGGIGGGGLFAQQLGGGTGLLETIASTLSGVRGLPETPGLPGEATKGAGALFRMLENALVPAPLTAEQQLLQQEGLPVPGPISLPGMQGAFEAGGAFGADVRAANKPLLPALAEAAGADIRGQGRRPTDVLNPVIAVTPEMQEAAAEAVNYVNEAIGRAQQAQGPGAGPGPRLEDVQRGSEQARQILALPDEVFGEAAQFVNQMAEAGFVFKTATGDLIQTEIGINKAAGIVAEGLALPDPAAFAKAQAQALQGAEQAAGERGRIERQVQIPGQLGQQLAVQPFMNAMTGIADASLVTLTNLGDVQKEQEAITRQAEEGLRQQADFIRTNLGGTEAAQFTGLMDQVRGYGETIAGINAAIANQQAQLSAKQYANNLRLINRSIQEAKGLAGQAGGGTGFRVGQIQREQFMLGRAAEALQLAAQELQIALTQRQINFQQAIAGFQAPGITGEERAARMEEARIEAAFAQQQLDIQKQQQGIAQQAFPLGGEIFALQTQQAVIDLEQQKVINSLSFSLEQEQIAAQKRIAVLTIAQSQLQAQALSLFSQATNNFDSRLNAATSFVSQFSGRVYAAIKLIDDAIALLVEPSGGGGGTRRPVQTGWIGTTQGMTDLTVGEAGPETVAILRNPRRGALGGGGGGGPSGMSVVLNITINDPVVRDDSDLERLARRTAEVVEERLGVKAGMLGG